MAADTIDRDWTWYMEWLSTAILIVGVALTAYNIYPANIYWSLAGNAGWAIVALAWRKWSLLTIQGVVTLIYIAGIAGSWS